MQYLTIKDVCALLGVKRWTLARYIRDEGFPTPHRDPDDARVRRWTVEQVAQWQAGASARLAGASNAV